MATKTWLRLALIGAGLLFALAATAQADTTYIPVSSGDWTGSRTDASGLYASGTYANTSFNLSWNISYSTDESYLVYVYTITTGTTGSAVSHFDFEVSEGFGEEDILGAFFGDKELVVGTDVTLGESDKNWPVGTKPNVLKFEVGASGTSTYTLWTRRLPVWGDLLIKDGYTAGVLNQVYNDGISTEPTSSTTDFTNWIPVPDTATVVPLPMAAVAGLGMLGVLAAARLNRRRSGI